MSEPPKGDPAAGQVRRGLFLLFFLIMLYYLGVLGRSAYFRVAGSPAADGTKTAMAGTAGALLGPFPTPTRVLPTPTPTSTAVGPVRPTTTPVVITIDPVTRTPAVDASTATQVAAASATALPTFTASAQADAAVQPTRTPLPPTATDTRVPPTSSPLPTFTALLPTSTPLPTSTAIPPTSTPLPTFTRIPPTSTPLPTFTAVPPTATQVPPSDTPAASIRTAAAPTRLVSVPPGIQARLPVRSSQEMTGGPAARTGRVPLIALARGGRIPPRPQAVQAPVPTSTPEVIPGSVVDRPHP